MIMPQASTLTPIDVALETLLSRMPLLAESENIPLDAALNRVLAKDQRAEIDVPGHDNSAMDGYALAAQSLSAGHNRFEVSQRIPAGCVGATLMPGTVARIFTGAPLPAGADTVVIQENCEESEGWVRVLTSPNFGENVRRAGADVSAGSLLFSVGHRLRATDIGLLAAVGISSVEVRRPLKVALLTTGDELARLGEPLAPGQIYNSNFYTLASLIRGLGHEPIDCGIVADTLEATEKALMLAAQTSDCVISSGGVSAGEEDHVRKALERVGELTLWKLAIKPGKPFAYGQLAAKPFFGLPGNPVSAFVTFALLVRPCLQRMAGVQVQEVPYWEVPVDFEVLVSGDRQEYIRVLRRVSEQGETVLSLAGSQSSGVLSTVSHADGLAVLPPHTRLVKGDKLRFIPLSEIVGQV
jgi:molybdopterin molybdotransferase